MMKVLLVDDEVLALNYLKSLIDWEENGYQIVGCATNGRKALEIYEKQNPDIIISDIRMPGMDGLELAKQIKEMNSEVVVILLSAYKDFEYAKKGIQYGVKNYLLKHELSEETLNIELKSIHEYLNRNSQKKKSYQKYLMNQLIYNRVDYQDIENINLGNRFFLVMVHRNSNFMNGSFHESKMETTVIDSVQDILEETLDNTIFYVADVYITMSNLIILYRIDNTASKYKVNTLIESKSKKILDSLKKHLGYGVNVLYSNEIMQKEISYVFQKMSGQIRYSMFWEGGQAYALYKLPELGVEDRIARSEQINDLEKMIYEGNKDINEVINDLFEQVTDSGYKLDAAKEMVYQLENTLRKIEKKEEIKRPQLENDIYKMKEIKNYYINCYAFLSEKLQESESKKYSKVVRNMMKYIQNNYQCDLNLEFIGDIFQMNGVYLGQVFKKEVGITFLKYLTNCRIEEAKRLLESGDHNVTEVAEKVGYKTSQYFSQIFMKSVGMTPQEYRKWNKQR